MLTGKQAFTYSCSCMKDIKAHFKKISGFYHRKKRMPSYREIMQMTGFKSTNAVHRMVTKMVADGLMKKEKNGRLAPDRTFFTVPLLGTITAGFPSHAEEELADALSLDEFLIRNRDATYVLVVDGDSMKDAGIMPGDMVLVERGSAAKSGDIVVALVDNQNTVKRYMKDGNKVYLKPENSRYENIYPQGELCIQGVVTGLLRFYKR